MKTALITGVLGQDGSLLAELLLKDGYRIVGIEHFTPAKPPMGVKLEVVDVRDGTAVAAVIARNEPAEIYHFAGQSSVGYSFEHPVETLESVATGTLNVLEGARNAKQRPRVFVACSGEIFGDTQGVVAKEATAHRPISPYAVAKSAAAQLVATYRKAYALYACSAFFYNHESPRRPEKFVTRKVVRGACIIARDLKRGKAPAKLPLGDTSVVRDWGWAPEYVEAARRMLSLTEPVDLVIATGKSCSLQHFVERAFESLQLNPANHVEKVKTELRPTEIPSMQADPSLAAEKLGWRATKHVDEVIGLLIEAEQATLDAE